MKTDDRSELPVCVSWILSTYKTNIDCNLPLHSLSSPFSTQLLVSAKALGRGGSESDLGERGRAVKDKRELIGT